MRFERLTIERHSPVRFDAAAVRNESRDRWTVVLEYEDQGDGPHLVDLSHCPRWDLQDRHLDAVELGGLSVPARPGESVLDAGASGPVLVNRMNRTQASVWNLGGHAQPLPQDPAFTDVTEATLFVAVIGETAFEVAERLTDLDLGRPDRTPPFLVQGPLAHVPCQIVVLGFGGEGGILFTCSRGYGRDMTHAVLDAGGPLGLRPAGEDVFREWLAGRAATVH